MAGPNVPTGPILTERLFRHGEDAELKDQRIDLNRERAYVRRLTTTDRMQLQQNMEAWKKKNEKDKAATAVLGMLNDLKRDVEHDETYGINNPAEKGISTNVPNTTEAALGNGVMYAVEGYRDIPRYARDELSRFSQAQTSEEKIGIAAKMAAIIGGVGLSLLGIHKGMEKLGDATTPKGSWARGVFNVLKWTGIIGGTGALANWMINKGARPDQ